MTETDLNSWAVIGFVRYRLLNMDQCDADYDPICRRAFSIMSLAQRDGLRQLITQGPVWDGDVSSKAARDDLLQMGLASRACVKGEQGYTVANYRGYDVWQVSQE
jgi:hypothetical protein